MAGFPKFNNVLLSKSDIENRSPCRIFSETVRQNIECDPRKGRLFAEFVYHAPNHPELRDEFRRKLSQIIDYMRNRSCVYMKSDYLHVLSGGQIEWLQSEYDRWIKDPSTVKLANQLRQERRYFQVANEVSVLSLLALDVANEIEKYVYPPFNFIQKVAENAIIYMTRPDINSYKRKVDELRDQISVGITVHRNGPELLPVALKYRIQLFGEKRNDNPHAMNTIFPQNL